MTFPRLRTIVFAAGAVLAGTLLFWTSQSVQNAEDRLSSLERSVSAEEQSIRVLRAEWDYLNQPERLEYLANTYLGLSSSAAYNVTDRVSDLPDVFMPALPAEKPDFEKDVLLTPVDSNAINASAVEPAAGVMMRVPVPKSKPAPPHRNKSFDTLLQDLNEGGANGP